MVQANSPLLQNVLCDSVIIDSEIIGRTSEDRDVCWMGLYRVQPQSLSLLVRHGVRYRVDVNRTSSPKFRVMFNDPQDVLRLGAAIMEPIMQN